MMPRSAPLLWIQNQVASWTLPENSIDFGCCDRRYRTMSSNCPAALWPTNGHPIDLCALVWWLEPDVAPPEPTQDGELWRKETTKLREDAPELDTLIAPTWNQLRRNQDSSRSIKNHRLKVVRITTNHPMGLLDDPSTLSQGRKTLTQFFGDIGVEWM